jgi:hypothetical protein
MFEDPRIQWCKTELLRLLHEAAAAFNLNVDIVFDACSAQQR